MQSFTRVKSGSVCPLFLGEDWEAAPGAAEGETTSSVTHPAEQRPIQKENRQSTPRMPNTSLCLRFFKRSNCRR